MDAVNFLRLALATIWYFPTLAQEPPAPPVAVAFQELKVRFRPPATTYPPLAKMTRTQGLVRVRLTVNQVGEIREVEALEGPAMLKPAAVATFRNWLFEPPIQEGTPVSAVCEVGVPYRIEDLQPSERTVDRVMVVVEPFPGNKSATIDWKSVREKTAVWLGQYGLQVVEAGQLEPDRTVHLKMVIQTVRTPGESYVFNIIGRCSMYEDRDFRENSADRFQRVLFFNPISGQKGEQGFQEALENQIEASIRQLVIPPVSAPFRADQVRALEGLKTAQGEVRPQAAVVDFDYKQIRVKRQPAAPRYPANAKSRGIQGTVILELVIDTAGRPIRVDAREGPPELLLSAIEYALRWEFEPALLNGVPHTARFRLTMPFQLR